MSDLSETQGAPETAEAVTPDAEGHPGRPTLLLETAHTLSQILVTTVGVGVALMSVLAGADLLMVIARAGGAVLAVGWLLWLANWLLQRGVSETARRQLEEAARQSKSPMEWEA
ncbi:MAG: hypothetical protein HY260_13190 [Chloroflexi bacterium]|nr:hypothetical protein [Chloroflexota bacterium]